MSEHGSNGIVIGLVSDLKDEGGIARVKVKYPHLDNVESDWARLSVPMAGRNRGTFFCPEVGDEVLVAFELGDPRRPYILGSLWSQTDTPPPDDGQREKNNWRFIQSRSGHIVLLDDTPGKERIVLIDKDNERRVLIDSANSKIQVVCDSGDIDLQAPTGKITISANQIEIHATQNMSLQSDGPLKIQGTVVNIN
jgi:uncharacterized protein involved in type VI secretion and phage assembly